MIMLTIIVEQFIPSEDLNGEFITSYNYN